MHAPPLNFTPRGLYVGGEWVAPAQGKSFVSINPSNMESLGEVPFASETDVDRAVAAAKTAFGEWSRVPIKERARCLMLLAERIEQHADELALMDAVDSGNAIVGMRGDMTWTADSLRYFAGLITEIKGETSSQGPRHLNLTRRQPYGVVAKSTRSTIRSASASRKRPRRSRRATPSSSRARNRRRSPASKWRSSPKESSRPAWSTWSRATGSPVPSSSSIRS